MELGSPIFVPVCDPEMGFEKIVKIAHACGGIFFFNSCLSKHSINFSEHTDNYMLTVCKRQDVISMMKLEVC